MMYRVVVCTDHVGVAAMAAAQLNGSGRIVRTSEKVSVGPLMVPVVLGVFVMIDCHELSFVLLVVSNCRVLGSLPNDTALGFAVFASTNAIHSSSKLDFCVSVSGVVTFAREWMI
jgi:hypothetical protein